MGYASVCGLFIGYIPGNWLAWVVYAYGLLYMVTEKGIPKGKRVGFKKLFLDLRMPIM